MYRRTGEFRCSGRAVRSSVGPVESPNPSRTSVIPGSTRRCAMVGHGYVEKRQRNTSWPLSCRMDSAVDKATESEAFWLS